MECNGIENILLYKLCFPLCIKTNWIIVVQYWFVSKLYSWYQSFYLKTSPNMEHMDSIDPNDLLMHDGISLPTGHKWWIISQIQTLLPINIQLYSSDIHWRPDSLVLVFEPVADRWWMAFSMNTSSSQPGDWGAGGPWLWPWPVTCPWSLTQHHAPTSSTSSSGWIGALQESLTQSQPRI